MNLPTTKRSKGRPRTLKPEIRTTIFSSDYHIPFLDLAAYKAFTQFLGDIRPDYHIINGDYLDCTSISSFLKDPAEANRTEEELEMGNKILDEMHEVSPNTITKFMYGNHCYRLTKRLWEAPELLPFISKGKSPDQVLADCLSLDARGIAWMPYRAVLNHWGFYVTHGEAAGLQAARKELETHGVSGTSGHIHKTRTWERRDRNGVKAWYSIGGLCSRNVSYRPNNDWSNSIGLLFQVVGSDLFTFYTIPIIKGRFVYNNALYDQDGVHRA